LSFSIQLDTAVRVRPPHHQRYFRGIRELSMGPAVRSGPGWVFLATKDNNIELRKNNNIELSSERMIISSPEIDLDYSLRLKSARSL
jgi:hypothetical protein